MFARHLVCKNMRDIACHRYWQFRHETVLIRVYSHPSIIEAVKLDVQGWLKNDNPTRLDIGFKILNL